MTGLLNSLRRRIHVKVFVEGGLQSRELHVGNDLRRAIAQLIGVVKVVYITHKVTQIT